MKILRLGTGWMAAPSPRVGDNPSASVHRRLPSALAICAVIALWPLHAPAQYMFRWEARIAGVGIAQSLYQYLSPAQALRDLRELNHNGLQWQLVYQSEDPLLYYNPFLPMSGYKGPPGTESGSADATCALSCAASSSPGTWLGTKRALNPAALYEYWNCDCQRPVPGGNPPTQIFPMASNAYCGPPGGPVGFSWSHHGGGAYVSYWRTAPEGVCHSAAHGFIRGDGFDARKADNACHMGNPTHPALGSKTHQEPIYQGLGGTGSLDFELYYSTNMYSTSVKTAGWSHTYSRLVAPGGNNQVFVFRPNGYVSRFVLSGSVYVTDADIPDKLVRLGDGGGNTIGWTFTNSTNDEVESYDASGKLASITARDGASRTLVYSNANTPSSIAPSPGLLISVTDAVGRQLALAYDASGRLTTLTDPAGRTYAFAYDANANLTTITWPDTRTRQYVYGNADYANALTGIIDEKGSRYSTYTYGSHGRVTASQHAGGTDSFSYVYNANRSTTVTDPLGTSRTMSFTTVLGNIKPVSVSQPCSNCGGQSASSTTYDANGNTTSKTDFNGKKACYAYDVARNLETARVEGLLAAENCTTSLAAPPSRPDVRKITTTWHATFRLPTTITEPVAGGSRVTTLTYDASGNLLQKSIVAPKNDGTSATVTRTTLWTYATRGRVLTATDPNNRVTTYAYYADNDANYGKRGNLQSVTNSLKHVTQVTSYDNNGRPLTIVDPNGLTTTLTYDPRGRLIERNVGGEVTSYVYDYVGQLTGVVMPDNSTLTYTYDAAHRLTQIQDGLGNKIVYTLDGAGNRTAENVYGISGTLARTRSRVYDSLSRLAQDLGALSQTTVYGYDSNGNVTSVTDPLNHATGNTYDALNRLVQVLGPAAGTTLYGYDAGNNLVQVVDPRGLATNYTYDGLGNLTKQVSPDTGTTASTFDAAGNVLTRTDARGVIATYIIDDLNRATSVVHSRTGTPNETHTFTYDTVTNGKGRLAQVTDTSGVTTWTYTAQGRVANKTQVVGTVTRTVGYRYNGAGQLTSITTPSGQVFGFSYLNNRVVSATVNGTALVSGIVTTPFGSIGAWQWGNGLFTFRDYDRDGRLYRWTFRNGTDILRNDLAFDIGSRITGIADPAAPSRNGAYEYDTLDRLILAQQGSPTAHTYQYTYDAIGNRTTQTADGNTSTLSYAATSNQLVTMVGAVPATYLSGLVSASFRYNNANRLAEVQSGGTLATHAVNALGQRVKKVMGTTTTLFVYDEQGRLLGEYDASGYLVQETVWLENLPIATLRPMGTGTPTPIAIHYVHADHLGTPRAVTRPSDNAIEWRWDNAEPFGNAPPNENPSGLGAFKYNLRFPGQYFDSEIGTSYNLLP